MSSLVGSHGMALATAMAVSGTVILIALCRQKPQFSAASQFAVQYRKGAVSARCNLRSCISSDEKKRERANKKKRVHFAEVVVVEFDGYCSNIEELSGEEEDDFASGFVQARPVEEEEEEEEMVVVRRVREMPANRVALYNGILQDRQQRMACSY